MVIFLEVGLAALGTKMERIMAYYGGVAVFGELVLDVASNTNRTYS